MDEDDEGEFYDYRPGGFDGDDLGTLDNILGGNKTTAIRRATAPTDNTTHLVSHTRNSAPAYESSQPDAMLSSPSTRGWEWHYTGQRESQAWGTVVHPKGASQTIITVLLQVTKKTDGNCIITIVPVFPAPRNTSNSQSRAKATICDWTPANVRSPILATIGQAMDALQLPVCLENNKYTGKHSEDVRAVKVANTLTENFELPVAGEASKYHLEFRQAEAGIFDQVRSGYAYPEYKKLTVEWPSQHYKLRGAQLEQLRKELQSRDDPRWWKEAPTEA